ncbi:MAG TPA: glycosyltransferase family 39 protein [Longimicrobium sp.]
MPRRRTARPPQTSTPAPHAPSAPPRARRKPRAWQIALGLAALNLVLVLLAFEPTPYTGGDNGAYYALARSLAEGQGYLELWDPARRPHAQYPPVFPAILAAGMKLGVSSWAGFKLIVALFAAAAVALSYLWVRRTSTPGVALASGVLLALCPGVILYAHYELSDVPFWAFTMLALWGFSHLDPRSPAAPDGERMGDAGWVAVAIVGAGLAHFTRSAGLPLLVAAAVWLAATRRWKALAALAATLGPLILVWGMRGARLGSTGYLGAFRYVNPYQPSLGTVGPLDLLERIADNGGRYLGTLEGVLLLGTPDAGFLFGCVVTALAIAGWARAARRPGVAELWVPMYVGLLLLWPPTWAGERFLIPFLPLALRYGGEAVRDLAARWSAARWPAALAAAAMGAAMLPSLVEEVQIGASCRGAAVAGRTYNCIQQPWRDFFILARDLRGKLPAGSAVINRKPTLFYALSGYPGRMYPLAVAPPDTFFRAAREVKASYVVIDQIEDLAPIYLHPVLLEHRDDFCVVGPVSREYAALARIVPGGPPRAADAPPNAFRPCGLLTER